MTRGFLTACLCLALGSASLLAIDDAPGDVQDIISRRRLVVALTSADHPPFFMAGKDGKLCGYDIKLAEDIAAEIGVPVEFERSSKTFDGLIDVVSSGKADIAISKLSKTLSRSRRVMFTEPYIVLRKALLINRLEFARRRESRPAQEFIKHLTGRIGVIRGSSYEEFAKQMFPKAELVPYDDWEEILDAVYKGDVFAAFRDELEIKKGLKAMPDASLKLQSVVFTDTEDPIAMAVSADKPHLRYWLNHYLSAKKIMTNADELLDKYAEVCANCSSPKSAPEAK